MLWQLVLTTLENKIPNAKHPNTLLSWMSSGDSNHFMVNTALVKLQTGHIRSPTVIIRVRSLKAIHSPSRLSDFINNWSVLHCSNASLREKGSAIKLSMSVLAFFLTVTLELCFRFLFLTPLFLLYFTHQGYYLEMMPFVPSLATQNQMFWQN